MSKWKPSPEKLIENFLSTLEKNPLVEMRKMFGYPCAFIRGNLCMGLHEENWMIRLSQEDRAIILSVHGAKPFDPMKGRPMKEYVTLSSEMLDNPQIREEWIQKSIDYTSSLPVKAPKRKKARR